MRALGISTPEFGGLAERGSTDIAESQIHTMLDGQVTEIARKVLPGLGIFFILSGFYDAATGTTPAQSSIVAATLFTAIVLLGVGEALKREAVPGRLANALLSAAGGVVLMQALVRLWNTPPILPTVHVLLLVAGMSSMLLSWRWFGITLASSLGSWSLVAWLVFTPAERLVTLASYWTLGVTALLAILIHHRRLHGYRRRFQELIIDARNRESLQQVQSRYESAVRGANDGLWFWDVEHEQIYVSARWSQMGGRPSTALRLSPEEWWDTIDPYYLDGLKAAIEAHLRGESAQLEYKHRLRRQDGTFIWVLTRGLATRGDNGVPTSIAGSTTDVSHVVEIEQRLVTDALQDRLTGLANRHCLMVELHRAAEQSRGTDRLIALIFIDLDDFKLVNDNLGHLVGDQLLIEVSNRLRTCTRPNDLLARYGGDEFVLLLDGLSDESEAESIGRRVQQVLSTPAEANGHFLKVTAGIGISLNRPAVWQADELLRNADIAMYEAKAEGKGRLGVFSPEMHNRARHSWALYNAVRGVVEREECLLHYQPIVSLKNGRIAGAEALFRWDSPLVWKSNTGEFILAAEKVGAIAEIGEWVLRKACADAADWLRRGLKPIPVSVNVSAHQARLPGFARTVERILQAAGLEPCWLELELTETAFMQDLETVCANLNALADLGVRLAVDDFGTGYSNLAYLTKFPLKTLKIDGSFVRSITEDPKTAALTKGLISLAHGLGVSVTAEQVENIQQLKFLTAESCDRVQGYLTSRPLPEHEMARVLAANDTLLSGMRIVAGQSLRSADRESSPRATLAVVG